MTSAVKDRASSSVFDTLLNIVPSNIVEAAAGTKLLGLVFFSVLFGYFLARIESPYRETVTDFWQGVFRVMMRMTEFVMYLAPIGVFALTARVVAKAGISAAGPILVFGACVVTGLVLYVALALPALIRLVGRVRPWPLFPAMTPALLTAFSTASSSSATLPLSMECVEKRANVSERIAGFVMPLGASVNHAGSALYECAAAMFICQAYGLHLSFATQFTVVVLALITSMGIAGIPAASLVGIAVILSAVGLPTEAIGVLLVLDRILDMARTAVNVFADAACAVIVARLEGETQVLQRVRIRPDFRRIRTFMYVAGEREKRCIVACTRSSGRAARYGQQSSLSLIPSITCATSSTREGRHEYRERSGVCAVGQHRRARAARSRMSLAQRSDASRKTHCQGAVPVHAGQRRCAQQLLLSRCRCHLRANAGRRSRRWARRASSSRCCRAATASIDKREKRSCLHLTSIHCRNTCWCYQNRMRVDAVSSEAAGRVESHDPAPAGGMRYR